MKIIKLLLSALLVLSLAACSSSAAEPEDTADAQDEVTTDEYLAALSGTYEELFPAMGRDENKQIWYDNFKEVLGVEDEETAEVLRQVILSMFSAEVYGEEAVALAAEDPTYYQFDCYFIDGVSTIAFEGNTISGYDAEGNEVFSHSYTYVEDMKTDFGAMNETYEAYFTEETWPTFAIYESDGEDDDFKYFAFGGDTPAETYHIEFRYGPSTDGLTSYYDGSYAYWLASGMLVDCPQEMMENVINLFVTENADSFAQMLQ